MKTKQQPIPTEAPLYATDLDYLQDELAWIEARARRIGAERQLEGGGEEDESPFGRGRKATSPQVLRARRNRYRADEDASRAVIDARLAAHATAAKPLALDRMVALHGLTAMERTILLLAAAPCFSRRFEDVYGLMDKDGASGLNVEAVYAFCELQAAERVDARSLFSEKGRLVGDDLVTIHQSGRYYDPKDLLLMEVAITGRTFAWMVGRDGLAEEFMEFSSVETPKATLDQVVLGEDDKRRILSVVERHEDWLRCRRDWGFDDVIRYGRGVLMLFHGKPGTGKTLTAHAVAHHMGRRVLNVDVPTFVEHHEAQRFLPGLFREARLHDAVLFFDECEVLFGDRRHGNVLMTLLLTEIERFEGVAILATNLPEVLDEALSRRVLVKIRFPEPDRQARLEIWRKHLPEAAPLAPDIDLELLADRYEMAGGYIKNAVLVAVADAVHTGGEAGRPGPVITMAQLDRAARDQTKQPTSDDTEAVMPRVRLADVVLPTALHASVTEIVRAARSRRTVLERWGIGSHLSFGKGLSALFSGGPGTGKTLCAEAVAGELSRPLLTASVPSLVSKWVGETERNLERLFREARAAGAVLFLDEADSLLRERGDGRASRHDDAAVNVLLSLLERHDGLVLLATNLPDRLDRALDRRLSYRLHFPFPDAAARAAIWRRLVPDTAPRDGDLDFDALGARWRLAGGHIKNAVFKAAFRAASAGLPLEQEQLDVAAAEEQAQCGEAPRAVIGFGQRGCGD